MTVQNSEHLAVVAVGGENDWRSVEVGLLKRLRVPVLSMEWRQCGVVFAADRSRRQVGDAPRALTQPRNERTVTHRVGEFHWRNTWGSNGVPYLNCELKHACAPFGTATNNNMTQIALVTSTGNCMSVCSVFLVLSSFFLVLCFLYCVFLVSKIQRILERILDWHWKRSCVVREKIEKCWLCAQWIFIIDVFSFCSEFCCKV